MPTRRCYLKCATCACLTLYIFQIRVIVDAARADGRDLKVLIVSDRFSRESGPARQQVVNAVLYNYIKSGALHSVSMRCWTPAEWEAKGSPVDLGAPCFYVSTGNNLPHDVECGPSLPLPGCTTAPPDVLPPDVA